MPRPSIDKRQKTVTEEPFALAESVKGRPLASFRRRGIALVVDAMLFLAVATPLLVGASILAVRGEAPSLARTISDLVAFRPLEDANRGIAEILVLAARRRPGAIPDRFAEALAAGDLDAVEALLLEDPLNVSIDLSGSEPSYYDPLDDRVYVNRDVLLGPLASLVGYAAMALVYFTLTAWAGRGRTPGKWLMGIRTVRLNGQRLRLWDAFSRAGGYAASLSMLGLGFVEARGDPNLQAAHDRLVGTVVIREPRGRLLRWPRGGRSPSRS